MSNSKRIKIFFVCNGCKERNYSSSKSSVKKDNKTDSKLLIKKFCKKCNSRIPHSELIKKK